VSWRVLAVDDEPLGLAELIHLLNRDPRVGEVCSAGDGIQALRQLQGGRFDVVFLDVNMPGLDGIELAGVLAGQVCRPEIVFVTAHEDRAAQAYGLDAVDYVLKPLRAERVTEALNRVERRLASTAPPEPVAGAAGTAPDGGRATAPGTAPDAGRATAQDGGQDLAVILIDDGRRTFFIRREDVLFAEARRDYVHLHTRGAHAGVHVVRMALSVLEANWSQHGFLRVHRSYLVALRAVTEIARDPLGGQLVRVAGHDLPVSRRQSGVLRDRVRALGRRGGPTAGPG